MNATELSIIITAIASAFVLIATLFFKQMNKQEARSNKVICAFLKSVDENTKSNREIAKATTRSADEARQRNGHLAELVEKAQTTAVEAANRNLKAYQDMEKQHIKVQEVDKQRIKIKE